jgi:hypothetical protein
MIAEVSTIPAWITLSSATFSVSARSSDGSNWVQFLIWRREAGAVPITYEI